MSTDSPDIPQRHSDGSKAVDPLIIRPCHLGNYFARDGWNGMRAAEGCRNGTILRRQRDLTGASLSDSNCKTGPDQSRSGFELQRKPLRAPSSSPVRGRHGTEHARPSGCSKSLRVDSQQFNLRSGLGAYAIDALEGARRFWAFARVWTWLL
jgi:hypothetical protein